MDLLKHLIRKKSNKKENFSFELKISIKSSVVLTSDKQFIPKNCGTLKSSDEL